MSSIYKIQRWDGVYTENDKSTLNSGHPAIYLFPDEDLLEYLRKNKHTIPIKITGTNCGYDNQLAYATAQLSQYTAGYRPNFQEITNTIVLVPDIVWNGYPRDLGEVHVLVDKSCKGKECDDVCKTDPNGVKCKLKKYNVCKIILMILAVCVLLYILSII